MSTAIGWPRAGASSMARSPTRSARTAGPSPPGSTRAIRRGTPSARSACTWPRTAATMTIRSPSSPPTPCARGPAARSSTGRWRRPSTSPPRASDRQALLNLLVPLQRAAEQVPWLNELVDSGAVYEAMAWTPAEAHRFLQRDPRLRGGRPGRARARLVARAPPAAARGLRARRRQEAERARHRRPARLLGGRRARRRQAHGRRGARADGVRPAGWCGCGASGSSWTASACARCSTTGSACGARPKRAGCRSSRACDCWPAPAAATPRLPRWRRPRAGHGWRPARGSRARSTGLRGPDGLAAADAGADLRGTLRPYQKTGVALAGLRLVAAPRRLPGRRHGAGQDGPGAGAPAAAQAPRPRRRAAPPARGAGLAARQLAGGDRALRALADARWSPIRRRCRRASWPTWRAPSWTASTWSSPPTARWRAWRRCARASGRWSCSTRRRRSRIRARARRRRSRR